MNKTLGGWLLALTVAAGLLSPGRAAETAAALPQMTIVKTPKPPTIDGKMEPGEWDFAAAGTGFHVNGRPFERLAHNQSVFFLTYDDQYIYFCVKNYRAPEHQLVRKSAREGDDVRIVFDDANEFWLTPPGQPEATHQTLFNAYPAVYDVKFIRAVGYQSKGWTARWEMASGETKDYWIVEGKAPIRSFGAAVKDGDSWGFLFTTDLLGIKEGGFRRWGPWVTGAFADTAGHDKLTFRANGPVLQVLDVESVATGKPSFPMAVTGPAKGAATVNVALRFGAGPEAAPGDIVVPKTVAVADGKREEFVLQADLAALALPQAALDAGVAQVPHGFCEITATTAAGVRIYSQLFHFAIDHYVRTGPPELLDSPYKTAFGVKAFHAPLDKKVVVTVDRYYMKARASVAGGEIRLVDNLSGKVEATTRITSFRNDCANGLLDIKALQLPVQTDADWAANQPVRDTADPSKIIKPAPEKPVGPQAKDMTVEVVLLDAQGKQVATASEPVKLMEYQFEWLGHDLGISDAVIPPWTPLAWKDGVLSMWNKSYRLNALGLAEEIVNAGARQLSGPMKLVAVVDGKEMVIAAGKPVPGQLHEANASFTGTASLGDLEIRVSTRAEMDGFVFNRMTLNPKKPVRLDRLSLVVTMPKSEAACLVSTAGGWSATHGWTPARWSSREMASGTRVGSFVPYVVLTDSDRAFCWAADNDQGWVIDPGGEAVEVFTEGETTTLRVNFVQMPVELSAARTIEYAWMVTPQKPQPSGWRACGITYITAYPKVPWTVFYADFDRRVSWDYYSAPYPKNMAKSREEIQSWLKMRPKVQYCVGHTGDAFGFFEDYKGRDFTPLAADWGVVPGQTGSGEVTRCRGANDYEIWNWDRWIKLGGLQGIYFDINYLGEEWNYLSGTAYILSDGRIQPGYSYLGQREYHKRLRQIFHDNGKPLPHFWLHSTSGAPVFSWMGDVLMEGENVMPTGLDNDYLDAYPAARARSIGRGVNIGAVPMTMRQVGYTRNSEVFPFLAHQYIGWMWAHDIVGGGTLLPAEMEMWRDEIRFLPYWKTGLGVESKTKDVIVSAHVRPGHAVLWIVNTGRQDTTAQIEIDLAKLGLKAANLLAFDSETAEPCKIDGGKLSVAVPARLWRGIRLVEVAALKGDLTFVASFDHGEVAADEALGHRYAGGTQVQVPDAQGKTGRGISLDKAWSFDVRHHVTRASGRIGFALQANQAVTGRLLVFNPGQPVRGTMTGLALAVNNEEMSLTATHVLPNADPKLPPTTTNDVLGRGKWPGQAGAAWHDVQIAWQGESLRVTVDGQDVLSAQVPGGVPFQDWVHELELFKVTHNDNQTLSTITLGDLKGAVLDDLTMMRK